MRKPDFCLCENKGADQLRSNCETDQRLCFRYTDRTISLLLKSEISSFQPASVTVQAGLCKTSSEVLKTSFLASRLMWWWACFISNSTANVIWGPDLGLNSLPKE